MGILLGIIVLFLRGTNVLEGCLPIIILFALCVYGVIPFLFFLLYLLIEFLD